MVHLADFEMRTMFNSISHGNQVLGTANYDQLAHVIFCTIYHVNW